MAACDNQTPQRSNRMTRSQMLRQQENMSTPVMRLPASPFMTRLGYGTGVSVYLLDRTAKKGQYSSPWALKKVNSRHNDSAMPYASRLRHEAKVLKTLSHPNIIEYRASAKAEDGTFCLAMENGQTSLGDLIEERSSGEDGPFPASKILKVALEVAKALVYLHEEKRLLHGDMKSANILVKGDFETIKVCDFGVAMELNSNGIALNPEEYVGTLCWSAKEVIDGEQITHKTDIFSYGLTLWEMISLMPPHVDDCGDTNSTVDTDTSVVSDEGSYYDMMGTRPPLPDINFDSSYNTVLELFYCCTEEDPQKRPSAKDIVELLQPSV